jgi:hypothetical protein
LWSVPNCGQHLCGLAIVVIDGLLAQQHQINAFLVDNGFENPCHAEWIDIFIRLDQYGAISAHSQSCTQLLLSFRRPDRDHNHLGCFTAIFDAQSLFEGDFVERVNAHFYAISFNTGAVVLYANADVVVDDSFEADENLFHFNTPFPKW